MYLFQPDFRSFLSRFWRPETGVFLVIWLVLMVGGRSRLFRDPGTFWHTKVGQQLIDSRQLIYRDPFSYTAACLVPDGAWVPHQWLGECLMALAHRLREFDTLLLATVTLLAGLYAWLAHRLLRAGFHWAVAGSLTAVALAAGSSHFHVRPHLVTLIFFGLTYAFLCDFEMGRFGLRRLFWLVPVYVFWANIHGGMLGGLLSMFLVLCGWAGAKLVGAATPIQKWRDAGILFELVAACGLAAFVNPYGWRLPATWVKIMGMPHLTEIIQEHARLDPAKPDGAVVLVLAFIYLAVLAGLRPRSLRVTWLLPLVWLLLACDRIRHAPLFGIAAVLAIGEAFPHTRWANALVRRGSDLFTAPGVSKRPQSWALGPALGPVVVVLLALGLQMRGVTVPVLGSGWARLDPALWPVELEGPLRQLPAGTRVFNELNLGGFLIYYVPQSRIFIDDRCELYGEKFLLEYDRVARKEPEAVENWARQFRFDFAVTQRGSPLDAYFGTPGYGWLPIAVAESATLYERADCVLYPSR